MAGWQEELKKNFPYSFFPSFPLSHLSTLKIGGRGNILLLKREEELEKLLKIREEYTFPLRVLGRGSNTVFREGEIEGLILKLEGDFQKIRLEKENICWLGAGVRINQLMNFLLRNHLSGMEQLAGIPGSIGGAIVMNAGGKNYSVGESIIRVRVWEEGKISEITPSFSYRKGFKSEGIILGCWVKLEKGDPRPVIKTLLEERKKKFPLNLPSCGCVFRNPSPTLPAGYLIDKAGLKGTREGGLMVSPVHANFIVKIDRATTRDFLKLVERVKEKVYQEFGVKLEREVEIV